MSGEPAPLVLLDDRIRPLAEARLSPLDRGFLFGDAVYEAVKLLDGHLLFLDRHLERLAASLAAMRIPSPGEIAPRLAELVRANEAAEGAVYLQVSRGAAPGRSHLPPPAPRPTLFAMVTPIDFAAAGTPGDGLAAVSRPDGRWGRCDVKTTALAASVVGRLEAADAGADEVLFVGPDGGVREGGHTSLFVRDGEGWHTHPRGPEILAGVTRAVLLEEAARFGIAVVERAPRLAARDGWREALLCGTTTGVRALTRLDAAAVGDGAVGDGTRRFARLLAAAELAEARRLEETPA